MALASFDRQRRFIFENTNGVKYDVRIKYDGTGEAFKLTGTSSRLDGRKNSITKTALTVDAGSVAGIRDWHVSRICHAAVFNTTTALNSILNAAS